MLCFYYLINACSSNVFKYLRRITSKTKGLNRITTDYKPMKPMFRVWYTPDNEMYLVRTLLGGRPDIVYFPLTYSVLMIPRTTEEYVLMQFTGARDMRGKDIYDGDIIRKEECSPDDPAFGYYGTIGVVKYDTTIMGFTIDTEDTGDTGFYDNGVANFSFDEIKVIGNRFENPELLSEAIR